MLLIAGQTAGPIGLNVICGYLRVAGGVIGKKEIFFLNFFFSRAMPGSSAITLIFKQT